MQEESMTPIAQYPLQGTNITLQILLLLEHPDPNTLTESNENSASSCNLDENDSSATDNNSSLRTTIAKNKLKNLEEKSEIVNKLKKMFKIK